METDDLEGLLLGEGVFWEPDNTPLQKTNLRIVLLENTILDKKTNLEWKRDLFRIKSQEGFNSPLFTSLSDYGWSIPTIKQIEDTFDSDYKTEVCKSMSILDEFFRQSGNNLLASGTHNVVSLENEALFYRHWPCRLGKGMYYSKTVGEARWLPFPKTDENIDLVNHIRFVRKHNS